MPSVDGFVSSPVTELALVICRPSRIQAAPSPATMRVWNGDQLMRSSRAGIVDRIRFGSAATALMGSSVSLSQGDSDAPIRTSTLRQAGKSDNRDLEAFIIPKG